MSTQENEPGTTGDEHGQPTIEEQSGAPDHDQDADPSLNAPEGEGPDAD